MKIDLKNKTGVIRLNSGHSLMLGNKPEVISNDMLSNIFTKKTHTEIENFGLFETATPNYTTYYPDVTADDLLPKDEDFIYPIFRCLSATTVWKGYKPIDFSKPGVLKDSMKLMVGQTINVDHETAVGNAMGSVRSVFWQESYTEAGIKVPAGFNGEFMLDGKSNPRIVRGIMQNPPSIHSNSVSVRFEWEPSHKMATMDDFYQKLGTRDDKGNLYRLIVTKILQYSETSLVAHGADAFAQIIRPDGKINNPIYANSVYNFSSKDDQGKDIKYSHVIDYKTDLTVDLSQDTILNDLEDNNENQFNMKILELLEASFGLTPGTLTEENLSTEVAKFLDNTKKPLTQATADIQAKYDEVVVEKTGLETELTAAKAKADLLDTKLTEQKAETTRLYKLAKGDKADESIIAMIEGADFSVLEALQKDYKGAVEEKFSPTCKSCGSKDINRLSSTPGDEEGEEEGKDKNAKVILTNSEAKAALRAKKLEKGNK